MICKHIHVWPCTKGYLSTLAVDHGSVWGGFHTQGTAKEPIKNVSIWELAGWLVPHIPLPYKRIGFIKCWNKWNTIIIGRVPMHFVFLYIPKKARQALSHLCLWLLVKTILSAINVAYQHLNIFILFDVFYILAVEIKRTVFTISKDHYFGFRLITDHNIFFSQSCNRLSNCFVDNLHC